MSFATLGSFAAGMLTWTGMEYVIHERLGHRPKGKTHASREHLKHHAQTDYFTPYAHKALAAVPVVGAIGAAASLVAGPRRGLAFAAGVAAGWAWYEVAHRWIHQRPPRTAYGRWLRRHHLHHHFGHPKANHGVIVPLWDLVLGTYERAEEIRVPQRNVTELKWLGGIDPQAPDAPGYARGYRVV
jgi:sterol desaturase/sphingolipid hydroxylase (fatty acid hydroxylase superfamily)